MATEPAREPTISMRILRALVEAVEQAGAPRPEFLRAAQLETEKLDAADARLSRREACRVCELALDLTGDPALGLHWAEGVTGSTFVPVSSMIAHAASLRQGLASLARFERLLSDEPSYELVEDGDKFTLRSTLRAGEPLRIQRFKAEMVIAVFFRLIRSFRVHTRAERVCFAYSAPAYGAEYERVFEQQVHFDAPFTGIVFERALLDLPSPHKDEDVHEALEALAERRMSRLFQPAPYTLRVRELLVQRGARERVEMSTVARWLGLSARSLSRRLASEGKSYPDVEKDALATVAKHLLRDEQRTIQEAAYEMGFSDSTAFHRAFKRWTGTTPSAFRERAGLTASEK